MNFCRYNSSEGLCFSGPFGMPQFVAHLVAHDGHPRRACLQRTRKTTIALLCSFSDFCARFEGHVQSTIRRSFADLRPAEKYGCGRALVQFGKSFPKKCYLLQYLSYRILRYVHGVLNVDEKKLITQFGWKLRDEHFEPNQSMIRH